MIPAFPNFRSLEPSDRAVVEAAIRPGSPCADLNFTNLYAWDMRVALLHGNLVVRFDDYVSAEASLAFVGHRRIEDTAAELLAAAEAQSRRAMLRFVSEPVASALAASGLTATPDDSASDYIFTVDRIADLPTVGGRGIRRRLRQFSARHPAYTVRHASLADSDGDELRSLFARWAERKGFTSHQSCPEYRAFERFLRLDHPAIECVALHDDGCLLGFSTFELAPDGTAMIHFSKTDHRAQRGLCEALYWEEAKLLRARGVTHYNWGTDMGLQGLRQAKAKYQPCHRLKKYTVSNTERRPVSADFPRTATT